MNNRFCFVVLFSLVCFSLYSMERDKNKSKYTRPNAKNPTLLQSASLALAEGLERNGLKGPAKLSASLAAKAGNDYPTANYVLARLSSKRAKKQELTEKAADMNPGRPSEAVKESNKSLYEDHLKLARQSWMSIPQFYASDNDPRSINEEATAAYKTYEAQIKEAQKRYLNYLRSELYIDNKLIDEPTLKKEVDVHFLELYVQLGWDVAIEYWLVLKEQSFLKCPVPKSDFLDALLEKVTTVNTEKYEEFTRLSSPGRAQEKFEALAEQFLKHVALAKSHLKELYKYIKSDLTPEQRDEKIAAEFEIIKATLEEKNP